MGDQCPRFESAQLHKNYLKDKMSKNYGNLKTLNSSVTLPRVAKRQRKTFEVGMRVYSVLMFNQNVRLLRSPFRAVVE